MDGDMTGKALGIGVFELGNKHYDTKLEMGDMRNYIKKLKSFGLKISHYANKEEIEKVDEISDELLNFKELFIQTSLIQAGMDSKEAVKLCGFHYADIIKEGAIELWLGLTTKKDVAERKKLKN